MVAMINDNNNNLISLIKSVSVLNGKEGEL